MNKIDIAKLATTLVVGAVTKKFVANTIQEQAPKTPDLVVEVGSSVAGVVVADKLKPQTDQLVEWTAARIATWKR